MTIEALLTEIRDELRILNSKMAHIGGASDALAEAPKTEAPKAPKAPKQTPPAAPAAPAAAPAEKLEYPVVSAAVKAKVTGGKRDAVLKLLASYNIGHAQELKPEQYAEFLGKINAL